MWLNIEEKNLLPALEDAAKKLDSADGEVVLNFESVRRIDTRGVRAMEEFASLADEKGVKAALYGVNVHVHKVLTLVKLASRFSSARCDSSREATKMESCHAEPPTK